MKTILSFLCFCILIAGCQSASNTDYSADKTFEKNAAVVLSYLQDFQNENLDYDAMYSKDFIMGITQFGPKDTATLDELKEMNNAIWAMYDFEFMTDPINLLPGVNADTKKADGSVRYYGKWKITLAATDSTAAKSAELKLYESFDFDEDGKIVYQQYYGDGGAIMSYLGGTE